MKYFIVAGEASGDLHASNLMKALKQKDSKAEFEYFGGDLMQAQGGKLLKHYKDMAFMGFIPVVLNLKTILKNMRLCKESIQEYRPDVVILIDYPSFNLKIAEFVKKHNLGSVYYYISPKVWAWKEYRIKSFKKYVDKMLCILPFEVGFYKKHNYEVDYVGNPTVDAVDAYINKDKNDTIAHFCKENNLSDKPLIAILAGSRKQEIESNLPIMLRVVEKYPNYQPVIAAAPGIAPDYYDNFIAGSTCKIVFNQTYRVLRFSTAALVTSGTATLETAMFRVPQVVCYKTSMPNITYWGFKNILHTAYISLVNLIADKEVVKELFAKFFTFDNIDNELNKLLNDLVYRQNMLDNYDSIIKVLGKPGASNKAAEIIYTSLNKK